MKLIILASLLVSLAMSQIVACVVCAKIPHCPKELFTDSYVDTIYDFIISQTKLTDYPSEVSKVVADSQTNYTFVWPVQSYIATIDQTTHKFKVVAVPTVKKAKGGNSAASINSYNTQATVSNTQTTSEIMSHIDIDIRNKYFAGETVTCNEYKTTSDGYHIVYQKLDKTLVAFDVQVKNNNGNTVVTYQPSSNTGASTQSQTQQTQQTQGQTQQTQGQDSTISVSTTPSTPIVGGYQVISSPSTNTEVIAVISFLTQQFGSIIQSGVILGAAQQLVNGMNYQLNISIDTSSSAYYTFVVYRSFSGSFSLTSANLVNVASSYSFNHALTSNQISQISYFAGLQKAVVQQLNLQSISKVTLDQVFENYPYFQFVLHNAQYSSIVMVVKYDVLASTFTVISSNKVPVSTPNPASCNNNNNPPKQVPQVDPKPYPPKQVPQVDPMPPLGTIGCIACRDPSKPKGNLNVDDGFEAVSSDFLAQSFIQSYIDYLATVESCYTRASFIGLFWQVSDHNSLNFRFRLTNGNIQQIKVSSDYVQYTINHPKTVQAKKIPNCLKQNGNVCVKCAFKYYLDQGKCAEVALECSRFNYNENVCEACYQGYYLSSNRSCILANYLCQSSDQVGNCLTCYRNYRLTSRNQCAFIANGTDCQLPKQQDNPLCAAFNGLTCLKCVQACYMNPTGICKIPDPNCQNFDEVNEVCNVCMESYVLSPTSKRCLAAKNY